LLSSPLSLAATDVNTAAAPTVACVWRRRCIHRRHHDRRFHCFDAASGLIVVFPATASVSNSIAVSISLAVHA
jgi:hypothetical protein